MPLVLPTSAQTELTAELRGNIDDIANKVLATTGVPSASLAVVKDGKIAYLQAYGNARLDPQAASPEMRYSIGSISKQFTAAAILHACKSKASYRSTIRSRNTFPDLTRGNEVTIRELLSHTSGYQDYWPQDYVMPMMLKPVTAEQIIDRWATQAAGFRSRHQVAVQQYQLRHRRSHRRESQRNATAAAACASESSRRCGMKSVTDTDEQALASNRSRRLHSLCAGPAASRAQGRQRAGCSPPANWR